MGDRELQALRQVGLAINEPHLLWVLSFIGLWVQSFLPLVIFWSIEILEVGGMACLMLSFIQKVNLMLNSFHSFFNSLWKKG